MTTKLDTILASNSAFPSVEALCGDMVAFGYKPTFRCDVDRSLLLVVEELERRGLGDRCYVYHLVGREVVTCWGLPGVR